MYRIKFVGYDPQYRDVLKRADVNARAWVVAWSAVSTAPAGNMELTAVGVKLYNKLVEISEEAEGGNRHLKFDGGLIYATDKELDLFRRAVERFRENVMIAQADALMALDELLKSPKAVTSEELAKLELVK